MQLDDPLDAIAVHAWNGSWGVIATGLLAGKGLILQSYGSNPSYTGDFVLASDQSNLNAAPNAYFRQWGCFLGGNGRLLAAQIIYLMWLCGELPLAFKIGGVGVEVRKAGLHSLAPSCTQTVARPACQPWRLGLGLLVSCCRLVSEQAAT